MTDPRTALAELRQDFSELASSDNSVDSRIYTAAATKIDAIIAQLPAPVIDKYTECLKVVQGRGFDTIADLIEAYDRKPNVELTDAQCHAITIALIAQGKIVGWDEAYALIRKAVKQ